MALARVGWMFSTRLTSLIVFQTSAPNASTSARLTSASWRNGDRGSVNAVSGERAQPGEEPLLDVVRARVDVDGEVDEVGDSQRPGEGCSYGIPEFTLGA